MHVTDPICDLSLTAERLKPAWFHALLLDPSGKNKGTRMPAFREHLTPKRSNGLRSMVERIRTDAREALATAS